MRYSLVVLAAAASAVYAQDSDPCQTTYTQCIAAGTPEVACQCDLATCTGEDNARTREFCATATAGLPPATTSTSSTSSYSTTASIVTGTIVQPSGAPQITAPAGSVPLGKPCGADEQCGEGVQCWGSTAGTIRTCGNFNAACEKDSQCAFNTCSGGLCRGFLPESAYPANSASSASSAASSASSTAVSAPVSSSSTTLTTTTTTVVAPPAPHGNNGTAPTYGAANPTGSSGPASPSSTLTPYTGGASFGATFSGFAAIAAGVVAWML